jgi:predicted permease
MMRGLLQRLKIWWRRDEQSADLEAEMLLHRQLRAEKLAAEGLPEKEAAVTADRLFGNTTLWKEDSRNMLTWNWLEDLSKDLQYSLRSLAANSLFALVTIMTLALGIGANTAIFSVINAVLLRGLPVQHSEELVYLRVFPGQPEGAEQTGNNGDSSFSESVFERLRTHQEVFSSLIAYVPLGGNKIAVRIGPIPEEANVEMVSGNLFSGLGVTTVCGRPLTLDDEKNHSPVAVLGFGYWNAHLASTCAVVGQSMSIKGVSFSIVGVAARGFTGTEPSPTDVWIPLQTSSSVNAWGASSKSFYELPNWWCLSLLARLAPHVTPQQAEAQLAGPFKRAAYEFLGGQPKKGETPSKLQLALARGLGEQAEDYRKPLYLLLSIVGVILLIACGNVALLLAARNAARRREFSIRLAIGGSQGRLFRQLLTESLLLSAAGAAFAWLFAIIFARVLAHSAGIAISLAPDRTVAFFTGAIMISIAILFGLFPLLMLRRVPMGLALKNSSATTFQEKAKSRGARLIVMAQVALGLVLAVSAGLLTRTLRNLEQSNLGLKTNGLLVFGLTPHADQSTIVFYNSVLERLRSLPGVIGVTMMGNRIGSGWSNNTGAYVDGRVPQGVDAQMRWNAVGAEFFTTLGVPILQGRDFRLSDSSGQQVAIVNQTFVKRLMKNREVLGRSVSFNSKTSYSVIGVVADSKYTGVRERPGPMAYFPFRQGPPIGNVHIEMRTVGDPSSFLPEVRRTVASIAPDLAPLQPMTQRAQFDASISQERLVSRLSLFFGALAIFLIASGLYGTLAYSVSRRTSEFGVRMAIGCERHQLLWFVLREGMILATIGIAIGLPLAVAAAHWLNSMLFGLTSLDALTFSLSAAGIFIVCLLAGFIPALHAASIDPIRALRYE